MGGVKMIGPLYVPPPAGEVGGAGGPTMVVVEGLAVTVRHDFSAYTDSA